MMLDKFIREFEYLANVPNGTQKLRELILQLAVQGFLVPQDPADEPASVLLQKIQAKKLDLINQGMASRSTPPIPVNSFTVPHELPKGWEWVRLPEVVYSISPGKRKIKTKEVAETGLYPVVDQGQSFVAGYIDDSTKVIQIPGPVIVFGDHTRAVKLVDFDFVPGADGIKILRPICVDERYCHLVLRGYSLEDRGYGRHYRILMTQLFPLPPLAEQERIVAKVDELMKCCDELEMRQNERNDQRIALTAACLHALTSAPSKSAAAAIRRVSDNFNLLIDTPESVAELRKTIVQLAVQGRLVPQDPKDEPASALIEKIKAEYERLIREGEIKKQEPLPPIEQTKVPYDLPTGWEWTRMGDCITLVSGQHLTPNEYNLNNDGIPYLTGPAEFGVRYPTPSRWTTTRKAIAQSGDILLTVKGAGVGKTNLVAETEIAISRQLMALRSVILDREYLMYFMASKENDLKGVMSGIAIPGIGRDDVRFLLFPLPPLAEQKRIVAKVGELMVLCDVLEARLIQARDRADRLTASFVHHLSGLNAIAAKEGTS